MVNSDRWIEAARLSHSPFTYHDSPVPLRVRLGLRKADNFRAFLELAAFLQKLDALEAFEDVSLSGDRAGSF